MPRGRRSRRAFGVVAALVLAACASADPRGPEAPSGATRPLADERAELTIPASAGVGQVLERLAARADAGEVEAAWIRVHYLLDLFDDARFRGSDSSLRALAGALGIPGTDGAQPARGEEATDRALDELARHIDRITARERLHPGARAARTLVAFDRHPPENRREVFQAMGELKAIARGGGDLADNSRLRLFAYGRRALEDAARAPWADRPRVVAHALYPLYDADPERYFAGDPAERPPPPDPQVLTDELFRLLGDVVTGEGRLADAAEAQREALFRASRSAADAYPRPPDADALALPSAADAAPYDWTPVLELGDGPAEEAETLSERIEPAVRGDGRGRLAVALAAHAPASALVEAGRAAAHSGARELELLVATAQRYEPPAGDYWEDRLRGSRAERVGVIPFSLGPLGVDARQERGAPREVEVDPKRRGLGLHLRVERETWRIRSPEGALPAIASDTAAGDPDGELAAQLSRVRSAFSDADTLVVVPVEGASIAAVVGAAAAALAAAERPAFALALADKAPASTSGQLEMRIARRESARVSVEPEPAAAGKRALRDCYQDLLEDRPALGGTITLERGDDGDVRVVDGPEPLRACADRALGPAMRAAEVRRARATLRAD